MKRMAAVALSLVLGGCMSVGTKVGPAVVSAFQPGVTTIQQAEAKLGQPNTTTTAADGSAVIVYSFTHAQASGSSFIPIVGAFAGHTDAHTTMAMLTFDKNGRFVRSSTSQGQTAAGMFDHK